MKGHLYKKTALLRVLSLYIYGLPGSLFRSHFLVCPAQGNTPDDKFFFNIFFFAIWFEFRTGRLKSSVHDHRPEMEIFSGIFCRGF
jgi:hypothetical protein